MSEEYLKRIAEALENLNEKLIPIVAKSIVQSFKAEEGEKINKKEHSNEMTDTDEKPLEVNDLFKGDEAKNVSTPLPMPQERKIQWIVHEGRKYKACKFCENLVSWNHDTSNYDHFSPAFKYLYPKCNTGGG